MSKPIMPACGRSRIEPLKRLDLAEIYCRISTSSFYYLKFILEGYDNLAVLSAVPDSHGAVRLRCAPESLAELLELLDKLAPRIKRPCL